MVDLKNPYKDSSRDTLRQIAIMSGCIGSIIFCFIGLLIGIGKEYGDWTNGFDRIVFAMFIASVPFLLPFAMNLLAIAFLCQERYRPVGIPLLIFSYLIAFFVGLAAVEMGKF